MEPQVSNQLTKAELVVGLVASWLACRTLMLGAQPFSPHVQLPPRSWLEGQQGSSLLLEPIRPLLLLLHVIGEEAEAQR